MDEEKKFDEFGKETEGESFVMKDAGGPIITYSVDSNGTQERKEKKKGRAQLIAILLAVVLGLSASFAGGIASVYLAAEYFPNLLPSAIYQGGDVNIKTDDTMNAGQAIYKKVVPSVVGISTQTENQVTDIFGWNTQTQVVQGVGTGGIVDQKGYILTNSHVVSDGQAKTITVELYDGREVNGTVLWNDKSIDLAIVKVEANGLVAAELGDSDEMQIGMYTAAIGNPLGMNFDRSFTQGVISGLNRTITVTESGKSVTMEGLMQTDASINSGNSGGPLLNEKGEVIGINSAKVQSAEGLGFAIPINTAMPIVDEIKKTGEFTKSYIGIQGIDLDTYLNYYPDADFGTKNGVLIAEVTAGMGAEKAGLKQQDIITAIEGKEVTGMGSLTTQLIKYRPGDKVKVSYVREKQKKEVEVTLSAGSSL